MTCGVRGASGVSGVSTGILNDSGEQVYFEFWISLGSLLRSYTALHGLVGNRLAEIESGAERILARHGAKWIELRRVGSTLSWTREDGRQGNLELTEAGRLRSDLGEEEMDMAAEGWARELML